MITYSENDLTIMAKTIWGEARGEIIEGQEAVAWVIRNRATRAAYAHELLNEDGAVARVCQAPWQFSCWNANDPSHAKIAALSEDDYVAQYDTAQDVLEDRVDDPTNGADMYYSPAGMPGGVPPYWASTCKQVAIVGNQIFFDSQQKP